MQRSKRRRRVCKEVKDKEVKGKASGCKCMDQLFQTMWLIFGIPTFLVRKASIKIQILQKRMPSPSYYLLTNINTDIDIQIQIYRFTNTNINCRQYRQGCLSPSCDRSALTCLATLRGSTSALALRHHLNKNKVKLHLNNSGGEILPQQKQCRITLNKGKNHQKQKIGKI